MTKTITIALIAASLFVAAGAAHSQAAPLERAISISPSFTSTTRTECTSTAPNGGWLGPALGAIIGGGAGSQVGKGSGQAAAAAIGATLGAQAGGAIAGSGTAGGQTCRDITERVLTGYMLRTDESRDVFVPLDLVNRFNANNR